MSAQNDKNFWQNVAIYNVEKHGSIKNAISYFKRMIVREVNSFSLYIRVNRRNGRTMAGYTAKFQKRIAGYKAILNELQNMVVNTKKEASKMTTEITCKRFNQFVSRAYYDNDNTWTIYRYNDYDNMSAACWDIATGYEPQTVYYRGID